MSLLFSLLLNPQNLSDRKKKALVERQRFEEEIEEIRSQSEVMYSIFCLQYSSFINSFKYLFLLNLIKIFNNRLLNSLQVHHLSISLITVVGISKIIFYKILLLYQCFEMKHLNLPICHVSWGCRTVKPHKWGYLLAMGGNSLCLRMGSW